MTNSQDEENPAGPRLCVRCNMSISDTITSLLQYMRYWFATCYDGVCTTMRVMLVWWQVRSLWGNNIRVISSWWAWDTIFVTSCVIAVSLDPLFFYIPTINGEEKCLEMDTKLMTVSLVLRSFTDIFFIWDIIQIYKARTTAKILRSVAADFLAILPVPQVLIIVILYKNRDLGYLNVILLIQYAPRIYRLSQSFDNLLRKRNSLGLRVKIAFNFFLYILACHILGASWFFFSVQREMSCWHQTCAEQNTCGSNFKCNNSSSRNITKLVQLCPMNPPNSTIVDFGIFVNPLGTSTKTPINFLTKFSYSFWWGVRNRSNFGTNLETSTYLGEVWFATLNSVISLLLFVYLIGNNVQTFMQMRTMKAEAEKEAERIRHEADEADEAERIRQEIRIYSWMERFNLYWFPMDEVLTKIKEKWQENKEVNLDHVSTLLSLVPSERSLVCLRMLENLPVFKDMERDVLTEIIELMKMVEYSENTLIVEKDGPLDRMFVITEGTMGVHTTSTDSSPSAIIKGSLEEWDVYGVEQLLSWAHSTNGNLPISKETVKCHTKVECFVLTARDLKKAFSKYGVIQDNDSDQDHVVSIERESSSSKRSSIHATIKNTASRFRRRLQGIRFRPSGYRGIWERCKTSHMLV